MKKVRFVIGGLLRFLIGNLLSLFIKRDKSYWVFNCSSIVTLPQMFTHNTKYLFLFLSTNKQYGITPVWISKNKQIISRLKECGYKAYYKYSFQNLYYCLKSKYYFVDSAADDISKYLSVGAVIINFWHGVSLKKIGLDADTKCISRNLSGFQKSFYNAFKIKENYFVSNSDYDSKIFKSAYNVDNSSILKLGSPRLDILFNNIKDSDLFMEENVENIIKLKQESRKLLIYVPTFRDTGKDISGWLQSNHLKEVLAKNNITLVCKLHMADNNKLTTDNCKEFYKMANNADIYAVLKYTDALITDYSSVYFDYLLLDKPIIFYPFDLNEYISQDRELYVNYNDYTPGIKAYNEKDLIDAIQRTINGEDNYMQARSDLRNELFDHQDGKNCQRIVEFVKNLDK